MTTPLVTLRLYLEAELGSQSFMASGGEIPLILESIMPKRFGKLLLCTHRTDEGVCFPLSQYDAETLLIKLQALLVFTDDGLFCKAVGRGSASPCCTQLSCL